MSTRKLSDTATSTLGGRLKLAIKASGMKQREVAKLLGITAPALSRYVHNVHAPSAQLAGQMARLVGVPITRLLFGDRMGMDRPLAGVAEGEGEGYRDSLPGELRAAWQDLDEEERAALLRNAETLRTGDLLSREALIAQSKILGRAEPKRARKQKDAPGNPSRRGLVG
jgi:transcriptional regulator with XRE-family HTH domain